MKNALLVFIAVLAALVVQNVFLKPDTVPTAKTETAYERVMRTNTLRCAYALYPPFMTRDPNTGAVGGMMAEVMAEFEQASGVKVVWETEIDWGNIAATLQSGKADAFCTSMFATPKRGRVMTGSIPVIYSTVEAFARADDKRFDHNPDAINRTDVRISVNMGDLSEEVAQKMFPKAQLVYKGPTGGEAELFLNVVTKKADLVISGPSNMTLFAKNNADMALRKIDFGHPLTQFPAVIGLEIHEFALQQLINTTLHNLIDNGVVDRVLRQYAGADYGISYIAPRPQRD